MDLENLYQRIDEESLKKWLSNFDNEDAIICTKNYLEICYEQSISEFDDPLI